jgi:hypothetical protein
VIDLDELHRLKVRTAEAAVCRSLEAKIAAYRAANGLPPLPDATEQDSTCRGAQPGGGDHG